MNYNTKNIKPKAIVEISSKHLENLLQYLESIAKE